MIRSTRHTIYSNRAGFADIAEYPSNAAQSNATQSNAAQSSDSTVDRIPVPSRHAVS